MGNAQSFHGDAPRPTTPQQYQHQFRVQTRAAAERDALQSSPRRRRRGQDENAPPVALLSGSSASQSGAAFTPSTPLGCLTSSQQPNILSPQSPALASLRTYAALPTPPSTMCPIFRQSSETPSQDIGCASPIQTRARTRRSNARSEHSESEPPPNRRSLAQQARRARERAAREAQMNSGVPPSPTRTRQCERSTPHMRSTDHLPTPAATQSTSRSPENRDAARSAQASETPTQPAGAGLRLQLPTPPATQAPLAREPNPPSSPVPHRAPSPWQLIPVSVTKDQLRQRPWITVASTVLDNSVDLSEGSFRADAYQFTQANRDTGNPSILPIKALFSKRFTKKPVPKAHSNVTFEGYLSRYSETNDVADCFYVEIENITFQGRSYTPASAKTVETPVTTKRKRNFKFNFDDDDEAPSTPSPIISKRARLSGSDSSSSLTEGMTPVPSRSSQ